MRNNREAKPLLNNSTSSSIFVLVCSPPGPKPVPGRLCWQSLAMCPALPHAEQTMLLVMLALSWHCHALWSAAPQFVHRGPSPSRKVPLSRASSRSWVRLQE